MRTVPSVCLSMLIGAIVGGNARAADVAGDLDVTIRVIDSKQSVNEFINRIELPKGISEPAPAMSTQKQQAGDAATKTVESSKASMQNRHDSRKDLDNDPHKASHDNRTDDDGNDQKTDPDASDRTAVTDNSHRDGADTRERTADSHERHDDRSSESRNQRDSAQENSRNNWDKLHDTHPSSHGLNGKNSID